MGSFILANCLKLYEAISELIDKMDDKIITRFDENGIHGCGAYGALRSKKSEEVGRGVTKDLERDEHQHRPQLDLAGLGKKPWCMCVYIGV